jgi:hypothetical protein
MGERGLEFFVKIYGEAVVIAPKIMRKIKGKYFCD